jgi:hypothetical protein
VGHQGTDEREMTKNNEKFIYGEEHVKGLLHLRNHCQKNHRTVRAKSESVEAGQDCLHPSKQTHVKKVP